MSKQARVRLVIAHTLHVFALVVAFAVSLVASLLLNVNLPATRRFVCAAVTFALKNVFEGQLIIERVDDIGIDGVRGARVRVLDETGAQVVLADGINANAWVLGIVQSAAMGPGEISIPISRVYIDWADVSIDFNGALPRIAHAFQPRPRTTPPTPGPGRGVSVEIADIAIRHAWVHGAVPNAPPIDTDANDIRSQRRSDRRESTDRRRHHHGRTREAAFAKCAVSRRPRRRRTRPAPDSDRKGARARDRRQLSR